jgi:hypothetical protein
MHLSHHCWDAEFLLTLCLFIGHRTKCWITLHSRFPTPLHLLARMLTRHLAARRLAHPQTCINNISRRCLSSLPLTIRQIFQKPPSEGSGPLQVHGWIKSVRKQKRIAFAEIRDGTTHQSLQAVIQPDMARRYDKVLPEICLAFGVLTRSLGSLAAGMSVSLSGNVVHTPKAAQPLELDVKALEVLGECDPEVS